VHPEHPAQPRRPAQDPTDHADLLAKSVYTVAVDLGQHPVAAASVAKLDATWATMR
jgi:hypothetical protein